ncbi:MAG: right-handed parallel beta-helix repeat-containing protein [candidate division Zixibacteria bacterium]|nr:right-handed parallel beta-helix repeat-containing protein [candidate division Zixibacteria bacterium]MDH3937283.1 right-handed parallel beta-helix repeat-containing protein [candidate division Zixibacteria bacterium]
MKAFPLGLTLALALAAKTNSTVIYVPADQPTVQAGVDVASVGDTVQVAPGRYYEHVAITEAVTLLGETRNSTVIDASDSGDCILVSAAGVVIKNLSVQHGGPLGPYEGAWDSGIRIVETENVLVEDCFVYDNGAAGISLTASSFCTIRGCYIWDNVTGVYFYEDVYGSFSNNADNQIIGNVVGLNSSIGIHFEHSVSLYHSDNIVRSNFVVGNGVGMSMLMSQYNDVVFNHFYWNVGRALVLGMCMGGGENNTFHHNSFHNNNAGDTQAQDYGDGTDYWYSVYQQEGNYWSDYTGVDNNGDGIGDTPYTIEEGETYDLYPLMVPEDSDGDGFIDSVDNCPGLYHSNLADADHDFIGDECDDCTDFDGDGYGNPGLPNNTCPDDNCPNVYNPAQEDFDGDGMGDSCDYYAPAIDQIWTTCLGLAVDNDGNFGVKGNDADGGCNLDYTQYGGDCDPGADVYLYDGSPFVLRINGDDTLLCQALHNTHNYLRVGWGRPYEGVITTPWFDLYRSGTFVTNDYSIGLEQWFWVPKDPEYCTFIIKALKVYSFDGQQHDNVSVGNGIDWDIPGDGGGNEGGFDTTHRLIYIRGLESDGAGCQDNDARYGGEALLSFHSNDTCADAWGTQPYSAYVATNPDYLWPEGGLVASELDSMIHLPGYKIEHDTVDLHAVMTYFVDQTLMPGDTVTVYSALTTVREGSLPILFNNVSLAQFWLSAFVTQDCYCCRGLRGNIDNDPLNQIDISDLVALVDYMFTGGPGPECPEEADMNADGGWDIADLVYLVDFMFNGGPPPVACP